MKTERVLMALLVAAAVLVVPALALAQQAQTALAAGDKKFLADVAQGNMAEVELGKLAKERASSDAVKQFAQRMIDDHGKALSEVKELAQQKGLAVPADMAPKHRKLSDRLSKLSGAAFDRAYIDEMVKDHKKDVAEFRREAERAKDPDVKAWAAKTLPTLETHFTQIQQLQSQVKAAKVTK